MGKEVVEQTRITDDVDGSTLRDDTEPVELVHEGKTYSLYLSDEHRKELLDTLDKFTANVEPVPAVRRSSSRSRRTRRSSAEVAEEKKRAEDKKKQRTSIAKFAKREFPDYSFPQRAAIRADVLDAYYDKNKDAERHYS